MKYAQWIAKQRRPLSRYYHVITVHPLLKPTQSTAALFDLVVTRNTYPHLDCFFWIEQNAWKRYTILHLLVRFHRLDTSSIATRRILAWTRVTRAR